MLSFHSIRCGVNGEETSFTPIFISSCKLKPGLFHGTEEADPREENL